MGDIPEARSIGIIGMGSYTAAGIFGQIPGLCRTLVRESSDAWDKTLSTNSPTLITLLRVNKYDLCDKNMQSNRGEILW